MSFTEPPACTFYQRGACTRGAACRFSHDIFTTAPPPPLELSALTWPAASRPPLAAEGALRPLLILNAAESGRGRDLPPHRRQAIEAAGAPFGLALPAALSLRRQMLRADALAGGRNFYSSQSNMGDEAGAKAHADAFEAVVANFLTSQACAFETEEQAKARGARNTPDFRLNAVLNGLPCGWLDCKTYFAAASLASNVGLPIGKLSAQAARYNAEFGPGAFIFLCGVSADFPAVPGAQLLDAAPLDVSSLWTS